MAKSKTRFNTPGRWRAYRENAMLQDATGGFVCLRDYEELLLAYKGALCQLDRAGKRVARMRRILDANRGAVDALRAEVREITA